MKKKRFLSLLLTIVMLVSTLVMSGCGTEKKSGNDGNYDGELVDVEHRTSQLMVTMMENLCMTIQWNYSMQSFSL